MTCFRNNHSPGKLKHKRLKSQIIKKFLDHLLKVEKTHESCFVFHFVFQKKTSLFMFNLYIYMTIFFVSVDNHEVRHCVALLCSFDKSVERPTITQYVLLLLLTPSNNMQQ